MKQKFHTPKFGLRPDEAAFALGSEQILIECVEADWIRPVVQRHRLTLYDAGDVARCWARLVSGEVPSSGGNISKTAPSHERKDAEGQSK